MPKPPQSGYPAPIDGKAYDSEAPTQLWESPFKRLSEFPVRRAARRRERLEALLKGYDTTSTALLSSTNLTQTPTSQRNVVQSPVLDEPPKIESIPTGTSRSIRPVAGPRLAIFIALGVAAGGLAALQIDRFLSPSVDQAATAFGAAVMEPVNVASPPNEASPMGEASPAVAALLDADEEQPIQASGASAFVEPGPSPVPRLAVDVVPMRQASKAAKAPTSHDSPNDSVALMGPDKSNPLSDGAGDQTTCSRYPSVHIPTQLHPRVNPLMTSNQVFVEQGLVRSDRRATGRH